HEQQAKNDSRGRPPVPCVENCAHGFIGEEADNEQSEQDQEGGARCPNSGWCRARRNRSGQASLLIDEVGLRDAAFHRWGCFDRMAWLLVAGKIGQLGRIGIDFVRLYPGLICHERRSPTRYLIAS